MVNNTMNTTSSEKKDSALEFAKVLEDAKKSSEDIDAILCCQEKRC